MTDASFSSQFAQLIQAVPRAQAAHRAHQTAQRQTDETATARLAEAETTRANQTAWAAEQLRVVREAVRDGTARAPKEIDTAGYVASARATVPDARAGLMAAAQGARGGLAGMQEGSRQLLLWLARRSSILGGLGIGALVLMGALGLFIFGRINAARQAEATATAGAIAVVTQRHETQQATRAEATRAEATRIEETRAASAPGRVTRTPRPGDAATPRGATPSGPTPSLAPNDASISTRIPSATPTEETTADRGPESLIIGRTSLGTPVEAVRFGDGPRTIIFVGGMHAGFAPGTVALARQAVAHFSSNLDEIPNDATLYVVISASPDTPHAPGELVGRLNSNGVDVNRNWGCRWTSNARFRDEVVSGSGGSAEFSEPEVAALRDFVVGHSPLAVVFWAARAGWSSPGTCGIRPLVSQPLAEVYGAAAGYRVVDFESGTGQELNGDGANWLDSQRIPAISILLPSYEGADWENNLRGMRAVLEAYGE